jgi:hypothetical protein
VVIGPVEPVFNVQGVLSLADRVEDGIYNDLYKNENYIYFKYI